MTVAVGEEEVWEEGEEWAGTGGAEDEDGGDEEDLALGLSRRLVRDYGVNTLAGRIRVDPGVLV